MTEENLKWLENVFRRTVGDNGEIRLQDFKNIVHSKNVSIPIFFREIIPFIVQQLVQATRYNHVMDFFSCF